MTVIIFSNRSFLGKNGGENGLVGGRSQSTKTNLVDGDGFDIDHLTVVVFVDIDVLGSGVGIGGDRETVENPESFVGIENRIDRFREKNRLGGRRKGRVV